MAKILIIASYAKSLINFRGELIKEITRQGHKVIAMAPETDFAEEISKIGAEYFSIPMQRTGLNPIKDLYATVSMYLLIKRMKPDILLAYTVKPVIYGSLAAKLAGISNIYSMITGLGYSFSGLTVKQKLVGLVVKFLYKVSLRVNKKVFFQNPDDSSLFLSLKLIKNSSQVVLINGSGVDTDKFSLVKQPEGPVSFLLIARLLWNKGIAEFVEAALLLKSRYPTSRFRVLGPFDNGPMAIIPEKMTEWVADGSIEYLGETDDVRDYISQCSVYVLPSYREGTPRTVLEAMAMGRPVITTDTPGCRQTVQNSVNGFLVPVKDSNALAKAMELFILNPDLIPEMGIKSREIAVQKFDVHQVNKKIISTMGLDCGD